MPCNFEWYLSETLVADPGEIRNRPVRLGPFSSEQECSALLESMKAITRFHEAHLAVTKRLRAEKRVRIAMPVRLRCSPSDAEPWLAYTIDISNSGARITGVEHPLRFGQIVELHCGRRKAPFQVVWIGSPETNTMGEAGLECLSPEDNVWDLDLSQQQDQEPLQHELALARSVQNKFLPQDKPALRTLEYVADCIQARTVGGDYYDFLDMGPGRVGFVMADVSGKGIAAALLMANLQGSILAENSIVSLDLARLLRDVNRHFYEHTEGNLYATLFLGCYDDATRKLQYVNCGHNPPLLLHADGALETLDATSTVLGIFKDWTGSIAEASVETGAVLAMYTDGITEACDASGEEFGEARILQCMAEDPELPAADLLRKVERAAETFRQGEQQDDLTLLIARGL